MSKTETPQRKDSCNGTTMSHSTSLTPTTTATKPAKRKSEKKGPVIQEQAKSTVADQTAQALPELIDLTVPSSSQAIPVKKTAARLQRIASPQDVLLPADSKNDGARPEVEQHKCSATFSQSVQIDAFDDESRVNLGQISTTTNPVSHAGKRESGLVDLEGWQQIQIEDIQKALFIIKQLKEAGLLVSVESLAQQSKVATGAKRQASQTDEIDEGREGVKRRRFSNGSQKCTSHFVCNPPVTSSTISSVSSQILLLFLGAGGGYLVRDRLDLPFNTSETEQSERNAVMSRPLAYTQSLGRLASAAFKVYMNNGTLIEVVLSMIRNMYEQKRRG